MNEKIESRCREWISRNVTWKSFLCKMRNKNYIEIPILFLRSRKMYAVLLHTNQFQANPF